MLLEIRLIIAWIKHWMKVTYKNSKQIPLPPREFLLPPILLLLLYVLLLLLVVGEVGVLATALGLNSSASGFSFDVLRVLCKKE